MLVVRAIEVRYSLRLDGERRATAERVHEIHAGFCPVARTLRGAVEIETELAFR